MKDDMISRQAAIETVRKAQSIGQAHRMLLQLPSAQPVVISKSENTTECEDAVSRFEVLRLIDYSSHDLNDAVDNRYMQNEIKQLPSVTPKQRGWVPCSERNPEKNGFYLVTIKAFGWNCTEYIDVDTSYYGDGIWYKKRVLAWCELPTPYREGGQE